MYTSFIYGLESLKCIVPVFSVIFCPINLDYDEDSLDYLYNAVAVWIKPLETPSDRSGVRIPSGGEGSPSNRGSWCEGKLSIALLLLP